jgi:hypothetical protein
VNRGSKNDRHAKDHWGAAYDAIPKSVFATVAWHLAAIAGDNADDPDATVRRFLEELRVLGLNGLIPPQQVVATARAVEKAGA